jgi:hypothetical protein
LVTIRCRRQALKAVARPPTANMLPTRIFFLGGNCNDQVKGNGSTRMIESVTVLMIASAVITADWVETLVLVASPVS